MSRLRTDARTEREDRARILKQNSQFVQMQFTRGNRKGINLYEPFFMYIVENLGIKNSDAD